VRRTELALWVLIVGVPLVLLAARLVTGEVIGYGWGWQMFSL
jgi:hypothetical protein